MLESGHPNYCWSVISAADSALNFNEHRQVPHVNSQHPTNSFAFVMMRMFRLAYKYVSQWFLSLYRIVKSLRAPEQFRGKIKYYIIFTLVNGILLQSTWNQKHPSFVFTGNVTKNKLKETCMCVQIQGGSNLFAGWTDLLRSAGVHRVFSKKAGSTLWGTRWQAWFRKSNLCWYYSYHQLQFW